MQPLESLAHVALAAVVALSWLGLGSLLLRNWRADDVVLDRLTRLGAGALGFAGLTFIAGFAHLLYRPAAIAATALAAPFGLRELRGLPRPHPRSWPRWQQALAALVLVYALAAVIATCAPVTSAD